MSSWPFRFKNVGGVVEILNHSSMTKPRRLIPVALDFVVQGTFVPQAATQVVSNLAVTPVITALREVVLQLKHSQGTTPYPSLVVPMRFLP